MAKIHAVTKALRVLQVFSPEEPWLSLGEIARRLDLGKSTAHNLLNTLAASGFIEKGEDGMYALGVEIIALTQAVRVNVELRDAAAPRLRRLAEATNESVYLAAFDRVHVLYIYAVESPDRLRARTAVGDRARMHCTAIGKAILSKLPAAVVDAIVDEVGLPAYTAQTITERRALHAELALTAKRGYALDNGEHEENYFCVAAPILDRHGAVVAACSVSGTDSALIGSRLADIGPRVSYTAQEIARYLGFVPARHPVAGGQPSVNGETHPT
jgi:IclR family transcriptional regulator, acetate operon repressor